MACTCQQCATGPHSGSSSGSHTDPSGEEHFLWFGSDDDDNTTVSSPKDALALCDDSRKRRVFFKRLLKSRSKTLHGFAFKVLKQIVTATIKTLSYEKKLAYLIGASYGVVARATGAPSNPSKYPRSRRGSAQSQKYWKLGFSDAYRNAKSTRRSVNIGSMSPEEAVNTVFALFCVDEFCDDGGVAWSNATILAGTLTWPNLRTSSELDSGLDAVDWDNEFSLSGVPDEVARLLKKGSEQAAVEAAVKSGDQDENGLTDLVFFSRHPERNGRSLSQSEPDFSQLSSEWLQIRNQLVRPSLLASTAEDIVRVRGFQVHKSIAEDVRKMFDDAKKDGVHLAGGGYRTSASQIALRRKNCAAIKGQPTRYDIYERPSSQCKPPTAPPGRSNHEKGLAIDFDFGKDRSSPGFKWLSANAHRYGLENFKKEAWHWSVDGR